jgi:hypothetical protein
MATLSQPTDRLPIVLNAKVVMRLGALPSP